MTRTIDRFLDLRDPRGLGGSVLRRNRASHHALRILADVGADEVLALKENAILTSAMRTAIAQRVGRISDTQHKIDTHNLISHVIDSGRVCGLWRHEGLGTMRQGLIAHSRIALEQLDDAKAAEAIGLRLAQRLPDILASDSALAVTGAVILALVLFDGVLDDKLIDAVLDPERHDCIDDGRWLVMRHGRARNAEESDWRVRNWHPCAWTSRLLMRRRALGELTAMRADDALKALRDVLGEPLLPASMCSLWPRAKAYWTAHLSPCVYDLASDAALCESLPASALDRLVHARRTGGVRREVVIRHLPFDARFDGGVPDPDQRRHVQALRDLRRCLRHLPREPFRARQVATKRIDAWFEAHGNVGGFVAVMAHWARHAIGADRMALRGKPLKPSSVLRYLASFAAWLIHLCHDVDPARVDEPTLMDYLEVLRELGGQSAAQVRHVALQEFLDYATRFGGPAIDLVDHWGLPPRGGRPRANLITPREYALILGRIDREWRSQPDCLTRRRMRVMFLIAYWTGLRWSELAWLTDDAIWSLGEGEFREVRLRVQFSKTSFGDRLLLIEKLLPQHVLDEVMSYVQDVAAGMFGRRPEGALLFGDGLDPLRPPGRDTHDRLQWIMRQATGDDSIVFHDLRHTAATHIALRLLLPTDAAWPVELVALSDEAFTVPTGVASWGDWVSGRPHHGHQRCAVLAALIGHIDARVTICHYMHLAELVIRAETSRHLPRLDDAVLARIEGISVGAIRNCRHRDTKRQKELAE